MPKTRQQLSTELGAKAAQYKKLDDMLRELHQGYLDYKEAKDKYDDELAYGSEQSVSKALRERNAVENRLRAQKQAIVNAYGGEISKQVKSFFAGPKGSDDESVAEWVKENYVMARFCMSSELLFTKPTISSLNNLARVENDIHSAARTAKLFIVKHIPDEYDFCWGRDNHDRTNEYDYKDYMESNFEDLGKKNKDFLSNEKAIENLQNSFAPAAAVSADAGNQPAAQEMSFKSFADELKAAKTTVNSSEYKNIISALEQLDKPGFGPWGEESGLTPGQNEAAKLLTVKMYVDKYIAHKGNDGVKKNVYGKLAAVEKLNEYLCKKINGANPQGFTKEPLSKLNKYIDSAKQNVYLQYKKADIAENVGKARGIGVETTAEECTRTLRCMQRIIDGADPAKRAALKNAQEEFFNYPGKDSAGRELTEAAQKAIEESERLRFPSEKTVSELDSASGGDFIISRQAAYKYAQKYDVGSIKVFDYKSQDHIRVPYKQYIKNLNAAVAESQKASKVYANTEGSGRSARNEAEDRQGDVSDMLGTLTGRVRGHLLANAGKNATIADLELTDKQLVEKWPELSLKFGCYKDVCAGDAEDNADVKAIVDKYSAWEDRITALAVSPEKTKESNSVSFG